MPRFVVLDFMRWLLAVLVAAMHLQGYAAPHKAYLAVDFFFILSGFVLTGAYLRKAQTDGFFSRYVRDRIARLYPLHLATLLILVAINILFWFTTHQALEDGWSYSDGRAYTFVLNLLLLQNIGLTTDTSWNAPSWSISVEFFINIALGLILIRIAKAKNAWLWLLFAALTCYIVLFNSTGHLGVFTETIYDFINTGVLRGVAGISLGFVAWHLFVITRSDFPAPTVIAATSTFTFLLMMLVWDEVRNVDFLTIPLMFISVTSIAVAEYRHPMRDGRLAAVFLTLGASSYAVYLIHWPIVTFVRYQLIYAWDLPINIAHPLVTGSILLLVCIIAIPVYSHFELPAKRKVKSWFE